MKIINGFPPNYSELVDLLHIKESDKIVFTYGDTIYVPSGEQISNDLIIHEQTHSKQQHHMEAGAKLWWKIWMEDPEFRIANEVEAYGAQFRFICSKVKDKNWQEKNLNELAGQMSSEIYGNVIDFMEAKKRIRLASK